MDTSLNLVSEGKAKLYLPKTVFYNPVQEFNRDLSVLILKTYLKYNCWHHKNEEKHVKSRGGIKILDGLSASGLRSIRYAKELGPAGDIVKTIVANDLSEVAVNLIKMNIELNQVQDKVTWSHSDTAHLLHSSATSFDERFHVIDIDPFGTAAHFFDAAVKSIGEAGLLMITCTDTAVLCGNASESCFARYGSMSLRADFCHDAALRIILRSIESHAAVYGRYIKPLLSISADFYVRVFVQVFTQQAETKKSASKLSQIHLCKECRTPEFTPIGLFEIKDEEKQANSNNPAVKYKFKPPEISIGDRCRICGGKYVLGGPIWSAPIHDKKFLDLIKQELKSSETQESFTTFRRIQGMVYHCSEELDVPLFHSIDHISSILKMKMPRNRDIMSALVNAGYKVSSSHTNQCGLKTTAPSSVVWDLFCQLAESEWIKNPPAAGKNDNLLKRILERKQKKDFDFTYNPEIETESQKASLLRFQINPTKDWGPKPRPSSKTDASGNSSSTVVDTSNPMEHENITRTHEGDKKRIRLTTDEENELNAS